jgi:NAD(P)-dependent dehydrogenase (short-subunit alcohol dehydrogenase family)
MSSGAVLVTGANGGLGAAVVSKILRSYPEYHGLYTVRNPATASHLHKVMQSAPSSHRHDILALDLSNLDHIGVFAKDVNSRVSSGTLPPLRAVILNAAFQEATTQTLTDDKRDMTFAVNYLANFLLVLLLLRSMDKEHGRIVFVSSWSHNPTDPRTFGRSGKEKYLFTDLESFVYPKTKPSEGSIRYGASKLCLLMMMYAHMMILALAHLLILD